MNAPTSLSASGLAYSEDLRQTLLPSPRACHLPPTLTAEAENCGMDGSTAGTAIAKAAGKWSAGGGGCLAITLLPASYQGRERRSSNRTRKQEAHIGRTYISANED